MITVGAKGSTLGLASTLLVEDNVVLRAVCRAVMEAAGNRVVDCATAEEALRIWTELQFDAVITDQRLDGRLTGTDLIVELTRTGAQARLVLISGLSEAPPALPEQATFLRKPFTADALLKALCAS